MREDVFASQPALVTIHHHFHINRMDGIPDIHPDELLDGIPKYVSGAGIGKHILIAAGDDHPFRGVIDQQAVLVLAPAQLFRAGLDSALE